MLVAAVLATLVHRRFRRRVHRRFLEATFLPEAERRGIPVAQVLASLESIDLCDHQLAADLRGLVKAIPLLEEILEEQRGMVQGEGSAVQRPALAPSLELMRTADRALFWGIFSVFPFVWLLGLIKFSQVSKMAKREGVPTPRRAVVGLALCCLCLVLHGAAMATRDKAEPQKPPVAEVLAKGKGKQEPILQYEGKRANFALYLVPDVWRKLDKAHNPAAEVQFARKEGDAWGLVIVERIAMPVEALKEAGLANFREVDNNATIVREETRMVNGKQVWYVTVNAKVSGVDLTYYVAYYAGNEGSFQVITWTGQNLFEELKPELEAFLSGLRIIEKQHEKPGSLKAAPAEESEEEFAADFVRRHSSWLHKHDSDGNVLRDPRTGEVVLTPNGQRLIEYIHEARAKGLQRFEDQANYALRRLSAEGVAIPQR